MKKFCVLLFIALLIVPLPALGILLIIPEPYAQIFKPAITPITACITLLLGWGFTMHQNAESFF